MRRLLFVFLIVFFAGSAFLFFFRNFILESVIEKKSRQFEKAYGVYVSIGKSGFEGLSTVNLQKIILQSPLKDTLIDIDSISVGIKLSSLLFSPLKISNIEMHRAGINIEKSKDGTNFSFLFKKEKPGSGSREQNRNYALFLSRLFNLFFDYFPEQIRISDLNLAYSDSSATNDFLFQEINYQGNNFSASFHQVDTAIENSWKIYGTIDKPERKIDLRFFPQKKDTLFFPLLKDKWNLRATADTIYFALDGLTFENDSLLLKGNISCRNLFLQHWRLASTPVIFPDLKLRYNLTTGSDFIRLDTTSVLVINKLEIDPLLEFRKDSTIIIKSGINFKNKFSGDFFSAMPEGLFTNFRGIQTEGKMTYSLFFSIDTSNVDSLQFSSNLKAEGFKIRKYGAVNFSRINSEFQHTAFEKGREVRSFMIGPSNPSFTPLEEISTYLKMSVLTSEDGNFFYHSGFNEEMFRKSIASNIKEKRFVRGGSTISMQLIKNVFLTRNKNIARKLEEALLVWTIERNRIVSKERMFEIYLNLIEWGPGVYGIGEASEFYFQKKPSDLNLEESIFLAMIVPMPKGFKYYFDENGKLKESCNDYYRLIAGHLLKKGVISEEQKENLIADIRIKGRAGEMIVKNSGEEIREETEFEIEEDF